jgi:hypothetical protein
MAALAVALQNSTSNVCHAELAVDVQAAARHQVRHVT